MKKLFISFTSLLALVGENKVTALELAEGLFFFGCWRDHALNPGAAGEADERTWNNGRYALAHPTIVEAVLKAEAEGRAAWHNGPKKTGNPWRQLDDLLADNGFPILNQKHDVSCHYAYPGVRDAVVEKGIALDVVY